MARAEPAATECPVFTEGEVRVLTDYCGRIIAKWQDRLDDHASHSRIRQRDEAADAIGAWTALSDKLRALPTEPIGPETTTSHCQDRSVDNPRGEGS